MGEIRIACQADAGLRFPPSFTTAMTGKDSGSLKLGKRSKAISAVLLHPESLRFWALAMLESCPGLIWFAFFWASLVALMVKNLPAMQETHTWMSEDPLEK